AQHAEGFVLGDSDGFRDPSFLEPLPIERRLLATGGSDSVIEYGSEDRLQFGLEHPEDLAEVELGGWENGGGSDILLRRRRVRTSEGRRLGERGHCRRARMRARINICI